MIGTVAMKHEVRTVERAKGHTNVLIAIIVVARLSFMFTTTTITAAPRKRAIMDIAGTRGGTDIDRSVTTRDAEKVHIRNKILDMTTKVIAPNMIRSRGAAAQQS